MSRASWYSALSTKMVRVHLAGKSVNVKKQSTPDPHSLATVYDG